jgi:hypothetical protein
MHAGVLPIRAVPAPTPKTTVPTGLDEARAIKEYAKTNGGLKKLESYLGVVDQLIQMPAGFEGTRYLEILNANLSQLNLLIEYAQKHGGLKKLEMDVRKAIEVVNLAGGSMLKAKQVIEFLKEM